MDYLPRILDSLLDSALARSGAVQIKGPKWCGKTETAKQKASSVLHLQDPDNVRTYLGLAETKPSLLLEGATPRLIDEWQMAPSLWDAVRTTVDIRKKPGQFILTGSSTPLEAGMHSGVGRISRLVMRPMTLMESQDSSGAVSLGDLFNGQHDIGAISNIDIESIAHLLCRGGWPAAVTAADQESALMQAVDYIDGLIDSDVSRMDGVSRNSTRMRALVRSYARHIATQSSLSTIASDLELGVGQLSANTVRDYVDALSRAFVIEDLEAWNPALRSATAIRTAPTRHFIDPSLGAAILGATPARLLRDFESFGLMFESLCIRDVRVYSQRLDGVVFHYRDKTGSEADAVIVLRDGRWGLIEVKLGEKQVEPAANNLKKLAERIDAQKMGRASFLMVLTGGAAAYRRDDGVLVVPLGVLGP
ncbi:MAG: DUF4143 domain-containing protein [Actinomycetaceae bacterium]|nr:DUF4143 domain-containing protein [Actinomycetaceae bacterium]